MIKLKLRFIEINNWKIFFPLFSWIYRYRFIFILEQVSSCVCGREALILCIRCLFSLSYFRSIFDNPLSLWCSLEEFSRILAILLMLSLIILVSFHSSRFFESLYWFIVILSVCTLVGFIGMQFFTSQLCSTSLPKHMLLSLTLFLNWFVRLDPNCLRRVMQSSLWYSELSDVCFQQLNKNFSELHPNSILIELCFIITKM